MRRLKLRPDLLIQRDLLIDGYPKIGLAIRDEAFLLPDPDETVLLVSDQGKLYELNLVAAFIFEELRLGTHKDQIIHSMVDHFEISHEVAESDFDGFVRFLIATSLAKEEFEEDIALV